MPIRLKITLLFTALVIMIWALVCGAIYYFSSSSREATIRTRLLNRAITTSALLQQSEIFDQQLIHKIDSSTTISLRRKSVQVYEPNGRLIYFYAESPNDSIPVPASVLTNILETGTIHYTEGNRDIVGYHNQNADNNLILLCAAEDINGRNDLAQLANILTLCFIAGTVVSFAGGYFFSRQLLKPVSKIAKEVKDISAYSLDRRIETRPYDNEWFHLSHTLNELLDRLKESFEMQRRFISNASHELSTPLTLISSQIEISLQRNRTESEYRAAMETMLQDVRHISRLVQTLLKFATAAGNPGGLDIDLIRIDEILMRLPAEIKKKFKNGTVLLQFNNLPADEHKLLILGSEELIFTAISNIVTNACKYSRDETAIVSLFPEQANVRIEIQDRGIGISPDEINKIFDPFYRAQQNSEVSGFGLGLSLASRIIKMHKGSIQVKSEPGKGSMFTVIIPTAH